MHARIPRTTLNGSIALRAGAAFAIGCLATGTAFAQTCAAPYVVAQTPDIQLIGDTFAGDTTFGSMCGGVINVTGPVWVYRIRPWSTSTEIGVAGYSGPWTPLLVLVDASEPCGAESQCLALGGSGSPLQLPSPPFVDYWLYVTASEMDAPGSGGPFELYMDGYPDDPDVVFTDGFD